MNPGEQYFPPLCKIFGIRPYDLVEIRTASARKCTAAHKYPDMYKYPVFYIDHDGIMRDLDSRPLQEANVLMDAINDPEAVIVVSPFGLSDDELVLARAAKATWVTRDSLEDVVRLWNKEPRMEVSPDGVKFHSGDPDHDCLVGILTAALYPSVLPGKEVMVR